jgi:LL-diaminopimelate aminotransferase
MTTFKPADRLNTIPEYVFSRLGKAVKEVERQSGRQVLDLGIGTPDVPPSERYLNQLAVLIHRSNAHAYPGYGATDAFAQALIQWYQQRFGVKLETDELQPLCGAKDGIAHLPLALLDAGDEILVPDPGYPSFSEPASLIGAQVVSYDLLPENDFKIDLELLAHKVSKRSKFIWVNFPSNPTGQVATPEDLQTLVDFARQHNVFILYDNAYSEITFDGFVAPSILQIEGAKDCAVEIGSFSKSFSLAGYRMGWIVGNRDIVVALAKLKSQMDSGLSLPLQGLGAYVLTHPDPEWSQQMIASYKQRRDVIAKHLQSLGLSFDLPRGSLYIWAKIPEAASDAETYCLQLLHDKQVFVAPGSAFGSNGKRYVRVSICANIDNIGGYF